MSTRTSASAARTRPDARAAVTVLAGFRGHATLAVADRLLAADPAAALVHHDLTDVRNGLVRRTVRTHERVLEHVEVPLAHGCVSCTLREDVLPTLVRLGRTDPDRGILLALPEVVEPAAVAGACQSCLVDGAPVTTWLRFDSYLTVVDSPTLLSDLDSDDDLADRGIQAADEDDRGVAEVVARQIEFADTVLLWESDDQDPYDRLRQRLLAQRLAPWAVHRSADATNGFHAAALRHTSRHQPDLPDPVARALEGYRLGLHQPVGDWGVSSVVFRSRRPMHPQRLHAAMERITGQVLRARGHLWLATRPELVLGWESAGSSVSLGSLGRWLAATEETQWNDASDLRRLTAAFDWDPYYGDRGNHLVFIGVDIHPGELVTGLEECLLADAELATGQDGWRQLPDPFSDYFGHDDEEGA